MRIRLKIYLLSVCLYFSVAPFAFAGIAESFGLNSELMGRGMAGSAIQQSWSSAYTNPAAMAAPSLEHKASKQLHYLGGNLLVQQPFLSITPAGGTALSRQNANIGSNIPFYPALAFGLNVDMRQLALLPIPVHAGLTMILPGAGDGLLKFQETSQKFYDFKQAGRGVARPTIAASAGAQVWKDRLSLGIGTNISAQLTGGIEISEIKTDPSQQPVTETKLDIALSPRVVAGVMYRHPLNRILEISSGIRYRQASQVDADLDIQATLPVNNLQINHNIDLDVLGYFQPHSFLWSLGTSYHSFDFFLDTEYQLWSLFRLSRTKSKYESLPNFNDILLFRLGSKWNLPKRFYSLELQAGYGYTPSFTPNQTGYANYLDNTKHIFSLGMGRFFQKVPRLKGRLRVDLSIQFQVWVPRESIKKSRSPLADGSRQPNYSYGGGSFVFSSGVSLVL